MDWGQGSDTGCAFVFFNAMTVIGTTSANIARFIGIKHMPTGGLLMVARGQICSMIDVAHVRVIGMIIATTRRGQIGPARLIIKSEALVTSLGTLGAVVVILSCPRVILRRWITIR